MKISFKNTYKIIIIARIKTFLIMTTKLTLKLNKRTIDKAKKLALIRNTSVSKMVENYLELISKEKNETIKITPIVKSIAGVIKLPKNYDYKKDYSDYLEKKYE